MESEKPNTPEDSEEAEARKAEEIKALEGLYRPTEAAEPLVETDTEVEEVPEEITAQVEAAITALLSEPFPKTPYVLVTSDSNESREFRDFVIHKDIDSENQCIFVFDSIVDAFAVAEEYKEATGREAEPVECDIFSLDEERFWVKFYRANGVVAMMSLPDYRQNVPLTQE